MRLGPTEVPQMRCIVVAVLFILSIASIAGAKDRNWQEATVTQITSRNTGSETVILPLGNGIYGSTSPTSRGFYWIKTDQFTYVIPNYSKGAFINPWLRLTIGGDTKFAVDDSRHGHVIDDDGKDRSVSILQRIKNPPSTATK